MKVKVKKAAVLKELRNAMLTTNVWVESGFRNSKDCAACAVGTVIRSLLPKNTLSDKLNFIAGDTITLERQRQNYKGVISPTGCSFRGKLLLNIRDIKVAAKNSIKNGAILSAMSAIYESVSERKGIEKGRAAVIKFIEKELPNTFEIELPDGTRLRRAE